MDQLLLVLFSTIHRCSFSHPFLLLLLASSSFFIILPLIIFRPSSTSKQLPLPPGPKQWPIVGNLLQIGQKAHISMTHFAQIYGPLISLRLGTQLLVVASSPAAASAILKTHDRLLSARYIFQMTPNRSLHDRLSLIFSPECNEHWKFLRSIARANLFTSSAIESQVSLRRRKMNEMVDYLESKQGCVVEIEDLIFTIIYNTFSNLVFSVDLLDFDGEGLNGIKGPFKKMMALGLTPNLADFYPSLQGFDLQGLRKKAFVFKKQIDSAWQCIIDERRRIHFSQNASPANDLLDTLLERNFSDEQIHYFILELLSAGTDTTTTTLEWAMAELLKNRDVLKRVRDEINQNPAIDESNICKLVYLEACVKEILRLHPPAPFLLPRLASETCEVMGYSIPKGTRLFVNVWGIGRDPSIWEDPLSFKPERFIDSDFDFKGFDYRYLPFGGGRRICPGLPMATVQVALILATLIHEFDWSLPDAKDFSQLRLNGKLGVTLKLEEPLKLIPRKLI